MMDDEKLPSSALETGGPALAEFHGNNEFFTWITHRLWILSAIPLGLAGLALGYGLVSDKMQSVWGMFMALGVLGLCCFGYSLTYRAKGQAYRNLAIRIFPEGLLYQKGRRETFARWEDLSVKELPVIHLSRGSGFARYQNRGVYLLHFSSGQVLSLDGAIKQVDDLGRLIQQKIAERKLPQAFQALQQGETLTFGPTCLNSAGLRRGRKAMSWTEIETIQYREGFVSVSLKDGKTWSLGSVSNFSDLYLFLTLAHKLIENDTSNEIA